MNSAQRSAVGRRIAEARRCPKCGRGGAVASVRPRPVAPGEITEYCRWGDCGYGRMIPFPDSMSGVGAADDLQAQADALRELERVTREHGERPAMIEVARASGAKWSDIASSLGMSVTAARKLHSKLKA